MTSPDTTLVAVNFHLYKPCNYRCRFCFATFRDLRGQLSLDHALTLLRLLRQAGCEKLNFAGGEPTLHPHIGPLLAESRRLGLVTSIISNGARLTQLLAAHATDLDWVGLSVDSADEAVQAALGRGTGGHVARSLAHADDIRARGLRLKLNTVVTALNWREDMSEFVRQVHPERWKVFQVLPVGGQNDGAVDDLLIDATQFRAFVDRHASLADNLAPIAASVPSRCPSALRYINRPPQVFKIFNFKHLDTTSPNLTQQRVEHCAITCQCCKSTPVVEQR